MRRPEIAGGFERGLFIRPTALGLEGDAGEIMLRVEKIAAQRGGNETGKYQRQNHRLPVEANRHHHRQHNVDQQRQQAIVMFARRLDEGIDDHAEEKDGNVTEQDGQRMAHEQISETVAPGRILKLFLGHDRIGTDIGTAQPGIMGVMMIVGTAPDAAGTQSPDAEEPHEKFRQARFVQDGAVLLIVINDKQPQAQQTGQHTASKSNSERDFSEDRPVWQGRRHGDEEQQSSRENVPPTFKIVVFRIRLGLGVQSFYGTHRAQDFTIKCTRQRSSEIIILRRCKRALTAPAT
jgi:hypothetical protein